ncbi:MAG: bifunctional diaminohydroxyphosphoribosylaminopyrimidine deaminase/5-amino-6-(5-phosphoribosylamino)uracil reductase RibD [Candidatus Izimaplasma sp.]|nr:bifunctional diaminohydroxyphosphoribosylaminopyrimidine deaminase/5-amino-6-(5-phosphoribosylamino)uracil reductase RibD [Candidatus Izimaplasma bacterium]
MTDQDYMKRALTLAKKGEGFVKSNPLVGAVIVKKDRIIGEGYHHAFGAAHAEVNAINQATEPVEGATLFVNLEPCSHHGKTPPCASLIIEKKIARVVIGSLDPNPLVSGKGVALLKSANITVITGVLDQENKALNKVFFKYITTKIPYIILKTAMTLDGKIATKTHHSKWITSVKSRMIGHALRHNLMGIMVGINTVIHDDPMLTCRLENDKIMHPIRIIVDSTLKIPLSSKILKTANTYNTLILTTKNHSLETKRNIQKTGATVLEVPTLDNRVNLKVAMTLLGKQGISSILLEGGGTLNFSALNAGIVDEIAAFIAPKIIGGKTALTPVEGTGISTMNSAIALTPISMQQIDTDILIHYHVTKEVK